MGNDKKKELTEEDYKQIYREKIAYYVRRIDSLETLKMISGFVSELHKKEK